MLIVKVGKVEIDMETEDITIRDYTFDCEEESAPGDYIKYVILSHAKRIIQKEMDKYEGIEP